MHLENIVFDTIDPPTLGWFWERALGTETLTDQPGIFETRLTHEDGPTLDLCLQQVPKPPSERVRLHLDLRGAESQQEMVDRLLELGARHLDIGQGDVPWVVLADPDGNPFCVMERRDSYHDTGPIAALPLDCANPDLDVELWAWLTGWTEVPGIHPTACATPPDAVRCWNCCPRHDPRVMPRTARTWT